MTALRLRRVAAVLAVAALAAGCADTTDGSGSVGRAPSTAGRSTHDFPSVAATSNAATPSAPPSVSASGGGSLHPVPSSPLRTVTAHGGDGRTYLVKIWADVTNDTCFDHAYGQQIITFLTQHPCGGLHRVLGTTTVNGRGVGFAESSTGFSGPADDPYKYAGEFSKLELKDGTGSINDLMREGYRLPSGPTSVPASEAFNVVGQDEGVSVWDVWYLQGPTPANDKPLITMTEDLFLQI